MRVNDAKLKARIRRAQSVMRRIARDTVNDAAFAARRETPEYLDRKVDRATRLTLAKNVALVDKARGVSGGVFARLYIAPLQARYLEVQEKGGTSKNMNQPLISGATDKHGNVSARFRRKRSKLEDLLSVRYRVRRKGRVARGSGSEGRYFIGKPLNGKYSYAGIFKREGDKFTTVTRFVQERTYAPRLGLRDHWRRTIPGLIKKAYTTHRRAIKQI